MKTLFNFTIACIALFFTDCNIVEIKPDVVHWHGATPDSEFVHIGITTQADKGVAIWYGAVSDEEYNSYTMNGTEKQEQ